MEKDLQEEHFKNIGLVWVCVCDVIYLKYFISTDQIADYELVHFHLLVAYCVTVLDDYGTSFSNGTDRTSV